MDTWKSDSFVYVPNGENPLSRTHAQLPTPMNLGASVFRFFYSSRDEQGQSRPFYLDYDMATKKVLVEAERPVLELAFYVWERKFISIISGGTNVQT